MRGAAVTIRFAASLGDGLLFGILNFTLAQNLGDASGRGVVATLATIRMRAWLPEG
jgi:hypothetical protein